MGWGHREIYAFQNWKQREMETLGGEDATALNRLGTRTRIFKNEMEYNSFFRVGQHISRRTPCVSAEMLNPEYPIVFEEWQLKRTHQTVSGIWRTYYCRRARFLPTRYRICWWRIKKKTQECQGIRRVWLWCQIYGTIKARKQVSGARCVPRHTQSWCADGYVEFYKPCPLL